MENQQQQMPMGGQGGEHSNHHEPPHEGHPPHEQQPMKRKKPSSTVLIAAIIVVVAIILANAIRSDEDRLATDEGLSVEVGESVVLDDAPTEAGSASALESEFLLPEEFEGLERAERIINASQGKNPGTEGSERIVFGIVEDDEDPNTVYFATSTVNADQENFAGVYKYQIDSGRWHRLAKADLKADGDAPTPMFRVVGKDGRKLLVLQDLIGNSPGPCASVLLMSQKLPFKLYELDLDDPLDGLKKYPLSAEQKASEEQKVANCQASF